MLTGWPGPRNTVTSGMRSPASSMPPNLARAVVGRAAPTVRELECHRQIVVPRELLGDAAHGAHGGVVEEHPLVGSEPVDEQPLRVRRPGDVPEAARTR